MPSPERIKQEAESSGGVWSPWSQDNYLLGRTFGSGGVCTPLAVVFLRLQATREGHFNSYVTSTEGRDDVMQLKLQQMKDPTKNAADYLKIFGLKCAFKRTSDSESDILNYLSLPGYYLLGISNIESGSTKEISGHALAIVNASPNFFFFDPNYGAGAWNNAAAMTGFIKKYWKNVYQELRGVPKIERYFKR